MKSKQLLMLIASAILIVVGVMFVGITLKSEKKIVETTTKPTEEITAETTSAAKFKIDDRTDMCAQAIETFYEDASYQYQFNCIKSGSIYVVFPDGTEYTVKSALTQKKVTIEELEAAGLGMTKVPKTTTGTR